MPELPEVQTVVDQLAKLLKGNRILNAELIRPRLAPHHEPMEFSALLERSSISDIHRRGKFILIDLDNGRTLMVHLRMSGRFLLLDQEEDEPKFTHARFLLDKDQKLLFQDQRHFGSMRVTETKRLYESKELCSLAPEPFSNDFTPSQLKAGAMRSARPIKEFLLDQTKVCGVGNIYASEALFIAGIDPRKRANRLTRPKAKLLHNSIRQVLSETLELGKLLPIDPRNIGGSIYGDSDAEWRVYGREGESCNNCDAEILRIVQNGRSTFFCRSCQR